jgi:hypothetical protein
MATFVFAHRRYANVVSLFFSDVPLYTIYNLQISVPSDCYKLHATYGSVDEFPCMVSLLDFNLTNVYIRHSMKMTLHSKQTRVDAKLFGYSTSVMSSHIIYNLLN